MVNSFDERKRHMSELFHIVSDGSCDLPVSMTEEKNLTIVPFYVSFDDEHYYRENVEIGIRDFYQQMVDKKGVYPKSSMPATPDFVDAFMPYVEKKIPVICICITTKFSGSLQSAMNAKNMILEDYPDAQIAVIDSTINTVLQGLFVLEAVSLRDAQYTFEDAVKRLEEIKSTGRIFFTVGDMEYLQHGGRIGKVAALAGSVLGIRPIITLQSGEIFPSGLARGRKKSFEKSTELLINYLKENNMSSANTSICVGYGYDIEEGNQSAAGALETLKKNGFDFTEIPTYQIGATIGVHTGPYPLGFGVIEKAIH